MEAFYKNISAKFCPDHGTMAHRYSSETIPTLRKFGSLWLVTQETTRGNLDDPIKKTTLKKPDNLLSFSLINETSPASCRTSVVNSRRSSSELISGSSSRRNSADKRAEMSGNFMLSSPTESPRSHGTRNTIDGNNAALLMVALQTLKDTNGNDNSSTNTSPKNSTSRNRAVRSVVLIATPPSVTNIHHVTHHSHPLILTINYWFTRWISCSLPNRHSFTSFSDVYRKD